MTGLERTTESSFVAWLKAIADNQLQDAIKAQKRDKRGGQYRQALDSPDESMLDLIAMLSDRNHTPSRSVGRREAVQAVRVGIAGLPLDQHDAISLHVLEGKSLAETADQLDRTPGESMTVASQPFGTLREPNRLGMIRPCWSVPSSAIQ